MFPLFKKWDDEGRRARVVVSPHYADVLQSIDYVDVQLMDQPYTKKNQDNKIIERAMRIASTEMPGAELIHISPILGALDRHVDLTKSFITYMWNLCGELTSWGTLPLELPNRDKKREMALYRQYNPRDKPCILMGLHGLSSPFHHRKELLHLIKDHFTQFQIIDLSTVNAHRIYDLLGLYDRASCLVTIDTAHLHLSPASKVPVIALAQDKPMWKGSPMGPNVRLHVRYSDFNARKLEILNSVHMSVYRKAPPLPEPIDGIPMGAYNPSAIPYDGGFLVMYRFHPERNLRTRLGAVLLNKDWKIERMLQVHPPKPTATFSNEDPRLFIYNNEPWVSFTAARPKGRQPKCAVFYGRITMGVHGLQIVDVQQPRIGFNDMDHMEKNWVFFEHHGRLMCNYNHEVVYEVKDGARINTMEHDPYKWPWGDVHGGTVPIHHSSGHLLRFFHSRFINKRRVIAHRYHIGAMLIDNRTFNPVAISEHPIISGDERMYPGIFHYKPNVVFPASAHEHGDGYRLAVGVNDCMCATLDLKEEDLCLSKIT